MLDAQTQQLAHKVRDLVAQGLEALARTSTDLTPLRQALLDLNGPFLLVVAGEFNSGKSSLLNALLRSSLLEEGVTPTTDRVQLIGYAPETRYEPQSPELAHLYLPNPLLEDLRLVDTPGTNAILRHHQVLTERFLPRADLILFVTSADRPYTHSEAEFLQLIRTWGKKIVLVVNKMDMLTPPEREQVLEFVRKGSERTLGHSVRVFGVSARQARQGERETSGVGELEAHIQRVLRHEAAALKLGSPLGVLIRLLELAAPELENQLQGIQKQLATCEDLERLAARHAERTRRDFAGQVALVTQVVEGVRERGEAWLDETVRLGRFFDLIRSSKLKQSFLDEVVRNANLDIERGVTQGLGWLAKRERELLEDALHLLREAPGLSATQASGEQQAIAGNLEAALNSFEPEREALALKNHIQAALQHTALVEVGAVGLSGLLVLIFQKLLLDLMGIFAGLVVALLGLSILPRRKEAAKAKLRERLAALKADLQKALGEALEAELRKAQEQFTALYRQPCLRLEASRDNLQGQIDNLNALSQKALALREEVTR
ncbi:dynamin family protein [Calidithermus timidus]|jgi:small GTP-binding protein|uniref:dynamin family protein n=1 Tax=Calidithermus timidus TaxID=307124 RepID=UPI000363A9C6|nr:dynamin family protein [Calidithermus timidus]